MLFKKHKRDEAIRRIRKGTIYLTYACRQKWRKMEGDGRVRTCEECSQKVYDLAGLSEEEIEALFIEHNGKLCGRMWVQEDRTVTCEPCKDNRSLAGRMVVIRDGEGPYLR